MAKTRADVQASALDAPTREAGLRRTIREKRALHAFYADVYRRYAECAKHSPAGGHMLELGSGGGFAKDYLADLITSDLIAYAHVDCRLDARQLPFASGSLAAIMMFNVFHHIPDVARFLTEAARCLQIHGRILIVDQYPGWISAPVLRHLHHEDYAPDAKQWHFEASGPLSDANGALAWIVFQRDRQRFEREFPEFRIRRFEPHSPLSYWLAGGLKRWTLLPGSCYTLARRLDAFLARLSPRLCSFVTIELERIGTSAPSDDR